MSSFATLIESSNTTITVLCLGWTLFMTLAWRTLTRIENKLDDHQKTQTACQTDLPKTFTLKVDFEAEKEEVWKAINYHTHPVAGGRAVRE